jgi:hypothetical protein
VFAALPLRRGRAALGIGIAGETGAVAGIVRATPMRAERMGLLADV